MCDRLVSGKTDSLGLMALIGDVVEQEGFEIEITDEMVEAACEYHDVIKEDADNLIDLTKGEVVGKSEVRVLASSVDKDLWGTSDYVLYRKGHKLTVYDFKYGKGVAVDPEENEQMAIYAVGAMDGDAGWIYDEVELVIIQPRAPHADGPVRRWSTDTVWLKIFSESLVLAVHETKKPDAKIETGSWCRWCPAKAHCPAMYGEVQKQAQIDFAVTPAPAPKDKSTAELPAVELMTVNKLAEILKWESVIVSWYKEIKDRGQALLSEGIDVPGFKLVEGRSTRKWVEEAKVVAHYEPELGVEQLYEKKLLSPAKLEKIVGKKELAATGLWHKAPGPKSIARDSDGRAVVRSSAQDDFGALPAPKPKNEISELEKELLG